MACPKAILSAAAVWIILLAGCGASQNIGYFLHGDDVEVTMMPGVPLEKMERKMTLREAVDDYFAQSQKLGNKRVSPPIIREARKGGQVVGYRRHQAFPEGFGGFRGENINPVMQHEGRPAFLLDRFHHGPDYRADIRRSDEDIEACFINHPLHRFHAAQHERQIRIHDMGQPVDGNRPEADAVIIKFFLEVSRRFAL